MRQVSWLLEAQREEKPYDGTKIVRFFERSHNLGVILDEDCRRRGATNAKESHL